MSETKAENGADCFTEGWSGKIEADERAAEELPEGEGPGDEAGERRDEVPEAPVAPMEAPGANAEARGRDLDLFVRTYPGLRPEDVPREVWERAKRGESLVTAYMRWEAGELRRENEELRREAAVRERAFMNRSRSAGSQLGSGSSGGGGDPFEVGWEEVG